MSIDYSLSSLSPVAPFDLSSVQGKGVSQEARNEKVSKAMESLFVGQLTAELGKGIDGTDDPQEGAPYGDFIKQAMTEGVTQGGGFGLAKIIDNYLNERNQTLTAHPGLNLKNTPPHVKPVE